MTLSGFSRTGPPQASLAYSVDADHEGTGVASAGVAAVIALARSSFALRALVASYEPHNARSAKLLARAGFTVIGERGARNAFARYRHAQILARLELPA